MQESGHLSAAPVPWIRAAAFGTTTVGIGTVGHGIVASTPVDVRLLLAAFLLAALGARVAAPHRFRPFGIVAGLSAMQVLIHIAATTGAVLEHAHHDHLATGAGATMLLVHAVGVCLGVVVLLSLETQAWTLVQLGVAHVRRAFARFAALPIRHAPRPTGCSVGTTTLHALTPFTCRPALGMRGPPLSARSTTPHEFNEYGVFPCRFEPSWPQQRLRRSSHSRR